VPKVEVGAVVETDVDSSGGAKAGTAVSFVLLEAGRVVEDTAAEVVIGGTAEVEVGTADEVGVDNATEVEVDTSLAVVVDVWAEVDGTLDEVASATVVETVMRDDPL
jgi:hypothetical protein